MKITSEKVELVGRSSIFLDACAGVRAELHTDTGSDQFSHEGATCAESLLPCGTTQQLRSVEISAINR